MRRLSSTEVPIELEPEIFHFDENIVRLFNQAFHRKSSTPPLSLTARALSGMFKILNELEVDWKKLLHVSQRFDYYENISIPGDYQSITKLTRYRERAGSAWLSFEIELRGLDTQDLLVKSSSQIMVGL